MPQQKREEPRSFRGRGRKVLRLTGDRPACDRRNNNRPFIFVFAFALTLQNGHNPTLILSAASYDA